MFDWVYNTAKGAFGWVTGAGELVWNEVVSFVYGVVHGVVGWLEGFFGIIANAWHFIEEVAEFIGRTAEAAFGAISHWISDFVNHTLPSIWKWISHALEWAEHHVRKLGEWALEHIEHVAKLAWHWVEGAKNWVIHHVWRPLEHLANYVWHILTHWAHTAWWAVTHPAKLADVLFWDLVHLVQRYVWRLARQLGQWVTELVLANVMRFVHLVEDILAAVI